MKWVGELPWNDGVRVSCEPRSTYNVTLTTAGMTRVTQNQCDGNFKYYNLITLYETSVFERRPKKSDAVRERDAKKKNKIEKVSSRDRSIFLAHIRYPGRFWIVVRVPVATRSPRESFEIGYYFSFVFFFISLVFYFFRFFISLVIFFFPPISRSSLVLS